EVGRLAVEMHRDDRLRLRGHCGGASVGSILAVSDSQSTSTGVAPRCRTGSAEAMKAAAGTITSSPGPTLSASRVRWIASSRVRADGVLRPTVNRPVVLERRDGRAQAETAVVDDSS